MAGVPWVEVADRVFVARFPPLALNVGAVVGGGGVLLIDTGEAPRRGEEIRDAVTALSALSIRWVVNTHHHWDHVFGNAAFPGAEIWGHPNCRSFLVDRPEEAVASAVRYLPELASELEGLRVVPPDHLVARAETLSLGDRRILLVHPGRAHTDSDVVVRIPDAAVLFAGDVVEQGAPPSFEDSFPVSWAGVASALAAWGDEIVVPGHGAIMDGTDLAAQAGDLAAVAAVCRQSARIGGPPDPTVGPYPAATMTVAVRRGIAELSAAGGSLTDPV